MTKRLFDDNAYQTSFSAQVLACEPQKKGYAIIWD